MKAFLISFDYSADKATKLMAFHKKIKEDNDISNWWHHLKGTYILLTTDHITAEKIRVFFHQFFPNEHCFIIELKQADYGGWLPQQAWDWMRSIMGR